MVNSFGTVKSLCHFNHLVILELLQDASGYNTVKVNCRTDEIKAYDETNADINNALFAYPKVQVVDDLRCLIKNVFIDCSM